MWWRGVVVEGIRLQGPHRPLAFQVRHTEKYGCLRYHGVQHVAMQAARMGSVGTIPDLTDHSRRRVTVVAAWCGGEACPRWGKLTFHGYSSYVAPYED